MTEKVKNWGQAVADNLNPFTRLVNTATAEDGSTTIPYYQQEKVKEAALQSDYGCDCVFKAILARLDSYSPAVKCKTLHLIRALMLEGPSTFNAKISSNVGRFISIATAQQDARKDTVEKQIGLLAQSIHQACQGDRGALHRAVGEGDPQRQLAGQEDAGRAQRAKSDYQAAQEREAKLYRKRRQEELKGRDVIVLDKAFEQFDHSLPAAKMVSAAVHGAKKKHAPQELNNFTGAAVEHAKPAEVMAALDAVLKDAKEPVQNKFKALMIVDYMVTEHPVAEAITYFKANTTGLQRVVAALQADTAPKAQQMVQTAQKLIQVLPTAAVPERSSRSSSVTSATPTPTPAQAPAPQQPPRPAPQPLLGSQNVNAAFGGAPAVDTMFGAMEVRKSGRPRGNSAAGGAAPQQQQQADPFGGWGSNNSAGGDAWGGGFGTSSPPQAQAASFSTASTWGTASQPAQSPPQAAPPVQQQPQQQQAPAAGGGDSAEEQLRKMQEMFQANMAQMMAASAAAAQPPAQPQPGLQSLPSREREASISVATTSSAGGDPVAPSQPVQQQQQPQHVDPASPAAPSGGSGSAPAWGSSVLAPPPLTTARSRDSIDDVPSRAEAPEPQWDAGREAASMSPSFQAQMDMSLASPKPTHVAPMDTPVNANIAPETQQPPQQQSLPPAAVFSSPDQPAPAAPQQPQAPQQPKVTIEMLQRLREQMSATEAMLARQQQMFAQMQALYMQQQQAEMARLAAGHQ
eukprot:CAMPEP_0174841350 /NCGR_PEP_ID=MMETSP1114-20130205/9259_1 /TAXON_ID=312471 /ORGANISM="Neobodo designis, Strain CCAP 1951/1" /LENGTH=742 /DNA_ID=CAMNT_0016075531 /DNA_START=152 /DNA_END=2380 /DNA_ORIENTATION=+